MKLTPTSARYLIYQAVLNWLSQHTGLHPSDIQPNTQLSHYGVTDGAYLVFCNDVVNTVNKTTGRILILDPNWRLAHRQDTILIFVNAAAVELFRSHMSLVGTLAVSHLKAAEQRRKPVSAPKKSRTKRTAPRAPGGA